MRTLHLLPYFSFIISSTFTFGLAQAQEKLDWVQGMELGRGYDLLSGEFREPCRAEDKVLKELYLSGISEWEFEETIDRNTLRRVLDISLSAAYKAMTTSASGKASYLTSSNIDSSKASYSALQRIIVGEENFVSSGYSYCVTKSVVGAELVAI